MEIIERTEDRLILTDRKAARWSRFMAVVLFVATGIGMYFGLGYDMSALQGITMIVFGGLLLSAGAVIFIRESYTSTITFDRKERTMSMEKKDIFNNKLQNYNFSLIANVQLVDVGTEFNGWQLEIGLKDGGEISLSPSTTYNKIAEGEAVKRLIDSYLT